MISYLRVYRYVEFIFFIITSYYWFKLLYWGHFYFSCALARYWLIFGVLSFVCDFSLYRVFSLLWPSITICRQPYLPTTNLFIAAQEFVLYFLFLHQNFFEQFQDILNIRHKRDHIMGFDLKDGIWWTKDKCDDCSFLSESKNPLVIVVRFFLSKIVLDLLSVGHIFDLRLTSHSPP